MSKRRIYPIPIFLLYIFVAILVTWPIAANIGRAVPGSEGDVWVHLWTFRWVRDSLLAGQNLLFTDLMYHPNGVSLVTHNFAWFHIALWIPLQAVLGESAAYSLIFLTGFAFTAWTTYLFVYDLIDNRSAAFIAGLVVGFWPYTLSHHNHPNLIFIGFIPLALRQLRRFFHDPNWQSATWAGLAVGMIAVVRWQLLVYAAPMLLLYLLYLCGQQLFSSKGTEGETSASKLSQIIGWGIPALAIALALTLVPMGPLLQSFESAELSTADVSADETLTGSTDLVAYIVPPFYHPLWGTLVKPLTEPFIVNKVFTPFIGYSTLFLLLMGVGLRPKKGIFWFAVSLLYISFALGPRLVANGQPLLETMPYDLIQNSLLEAIIRRPDRLNVLVSIPVGILTALGFQAIFEQNWVSNKAHMPRVGFAIVSVMIIGEYLTRYPIYGLEVPAWHQSISTDEADYAILELPMHARVYDELYMQYQATHGKRLVGGHVSRLPEDALAFIQSISFLQAQETKGPNRQAFSITQDLVNLAAADVRYIVIHKYLLTDEQEEAWRRFLLFSPIYEDEKTLVYNTELPVDETLRPTYTFEPMQKLGLLDYDFNVPAPTQEGLIETGFVWLSEEEQAGDLGESCLVLYISDPANPVQESCAPLEYINDSWPASGLHHTNQQMTIGRYLDPAPFQLGLRLEPSGAFLHLGQVDINVVPRSFEEPATISNPADLRWNNEIRLLGHDLQSNSLTLYWQALSTTDRSYVRFIHIIDSATGQLVAQVDTAPRNWGYPTNWWKEGEIILEEIELPTDGLPSGSYEIYLGFYDRETSERLETVTPSESGAQIENRALKLDIFLK